MRFAYLGSGSSGNALLVESGSTRILLDCGFPLKETLLRLQRLGVEGHSLTAIVVTHEHDDHVSGVGRLARKFALPVWLTRGTWRGSRGSLEETTLHFIEGYQSLEIGDLEVTPFPVPHDAGEPAQYVFSDGAVKLGVLTDVGKATTHIRSVLSGCDALALECNHDVEMLQRGPYPPALKSRVGGAFGHLSNDQAMDLLRGLDRSRLRHVIGVHLSRQNNTPALARRALSEALGCSPEWVGVADQDLGLDWRQLS